MAPKNRFLGLVICALAAAVSSDPLQPPLNSCSSTFDPFDYVGCYPAEYEHGQVLAFGTTQGWVAANGYIESCSAFCKGNNYSYMGLQDSAQCWCGSHIPEAVLGSNTGESSEMCLGELTMSVYHDPTFLAKTTIAANYEYMGCYKNLGPTLSWDYTYVTRPPKRVVRHEKRHLSVHNIHEKPKLHILARSPNMQIRVQILYSGTVITLDVEPSNSIENIKTIIQDKQGINPAEQILKLGTKELDDERTLADYNIQKDMTLRLSIRSRGTSVDNCKQACGDRGYPYAGLELGNFCYCGVVINAGANKITGDLESDSCGTPRAGNPLQICGGGAAMSIYLASSLQSNEPCAEESPPVPPHVPLRCSCGRTKSDRTLAKWDL